MKRIVSSDFLKLEQVLIDVRSPGEYSDGHIPGAINIPLLNDEHRAKVGTVYKNDGKQAALDLGYKLVNPLRKKILDEIKRILPHGELRLYCARGGLRSALMAEFFSSEGYEVNVLSGGYKAYRNYILKKIASYKKLIILSGYTGSGKTEILKAMAKKGAQVLDLEGLARHKGSAFGSLGYDAQPSSALFHNRIFEVMKLFDPSLPVWVENESHTIGKVFLPLELWENMKSAAGLELEIPEEHRIKFILANYGKFTGPELKACIMNLNRRLGDEDTRLLCTLVDEGELEPVVKRLFRYYDKAYEHGRKKRNCQNYVRISFDQLDMDSIADKLISLQHTFVA